MEGLYQMNRVKHRADHLTSGRDPGRVGDIPAAWAIGAPPDLESLPHMDHSIGLWQVSGLGLLAAISTVYGLGVLRLRLAAPRLVTPWRMVAFGAGMVALAAALVWPLPGWSNALLSMRSLQKVLICMVAAPLIWLACPLHVLAWAGGARWRTLFVRLQAATQRPGTFLHTATQPLVLWFVYLAAFLFWHDPQAAPFLLGDGWFHYVAPWLLLGAALLFWWPVVETGPRRARPLPLWLLLAYVLGVEIANMVAGVTIAFSIEPVYPHYIAVRQSLGEDALPLSMLNDQMLGGALIWVFGSLVYIAAIILILHRLFRLDGATAPQPPVGWDAHAKFIAPGLEERAAYNELHNIDLSHR